MNNESKERKGGDIMSEGAIPIKKLIPIIVVTWVLSLVTSVVVVYVAPNIFEINVATDNLEDSAVITAKLADGTVTSAKILDGTLYAVDMADSAIITVKIANGAVTTAKIAEGAVTTDKIYDEAVSTTKILNDAVVTIKLADGSVTSAKILDGTVTVVDLADGSIITAKIANGAVTTEKIADWAVTTDKIADGTVTNLKLAANAIPFNSTHSYQESSTTSTVLEDMPDMSVDVTLERTSHLIIMFSTEAQHLSSTDRIWVSAYVGGTLALPGGVHLTPYESESYSSYTYNFYLPNVSGGIHTIKMRWLVEPGGTGWVWWRSLTVIGLPA